MRMLDARPYHALRAAKMRSLRAPGPVQLDARFDRRLRVARPRRLAVPSKGGFMPGLSQDMNETEVQVGYDDATLAGHQLKASRKHKGRPSRKHKGRPSGHHAGMLPGIGAMDIAGLLSGKNLAVAAGVAAIGYFLFKRK